MGLPCDWQITKQKISQRGQYILQSGQWSDCKFIVGQEPHQQILEGHKLFLAMSSPVFEAMFFGGMAEKNDPIPIRDVQPEAFKALLEYIYTDNIDLGSFELACELCYCAKKYMLPFLVEECTKFLWSDLSPKKACRAYEFAKLFEEPVLMEKCLQIICTKTNSVLKESSWEEIELATLITVFEQDELEIDSEVELFLAVERWARSECTRKGLETSDSKSLRSVIGSALTKIRFLTLTPQVFAEGPGRSPLLTQDEAFAILMNISSTDSKWPMPEGFSSIAHYRLKPMKIHQTFYDPSMNNMLGSVPGTSKFDPSLPLFRPYPGHTNDHDLVNVLMDSGNSSMHIPFMALEGAMQENRRHCCHRTVVRQTDCFNTSVLDCSVTFSVDRNICVIGIQMPTQTGLVKNNMCLPVGPGSYTEVLYAHLLDSDGSRLTYTHFSTKVDYCSFLEITFNRPVYIQKNKVYKIGVVLNKVGCYPVAVCPQNMTCDSVSFSFGVGNSADSIRDGLIRGIVFTYHRDERNEK